MKAAPLSGLSVFLRIASKCVNEFVGKVAGRSGSRIIVVWQFELLGGGKEKRKGKERKGKQQVKLVSHCLFCVIPRVKQSWEPQEGNPYEQKEHARETLV